MYRFYRIFEQKKKIRLEKKFRAHLDFEIPSSARKNQTKNEIVFRTRSKSATVVKSVIQADIIFLTYLNIFIQNLFG